MLTMEIAQSLASRWHRRTLSHVEFLSFLTRMGFGNQLGWSGPNRLAQRRIWLGIAVSCAPYRWALRVHEATRGRFPRLTGSGGPRAAAKGRAGLPDGRARWHAVEAQSGPSARSPRPPVIGLSPLPLNLSERQRAPFCKVIVKLPWNILFPPGSAVPKLLISNSIRIPFEA